MPGLPPGLTANFGSQKRKRKPQQVAANGGGNVLPPAALPAMAAAASANGANPLANFPSAQCIQCALCGMVVPTQGMYNPLTLSFRSTMKIFLFHFRLRRPFARLSPHHVFAG